MRISDWSSDVCSSDLRTRHGRASFVLLDFALDFAAGGCAGACWEKNPALASASFAATAALLMVGQCSAATPDLPASRRTRRMVLLSPTNVTVPAIGRASCR